MAMVTLENFAYQPLHASASQRTYDFHYAQPGMVAIIGGNGSGKSTLAQLMAGWYPDYLPGAVSGSGSRSARFRSPRRRRPFSWCSSRPTSSSRAAPSA